MKIISTIFYTIFIAFVIGIAGLLLGTMLPIPGNIEIKIVKSGSMEPAISTGSLVVVRPAAVYTKGDVVTFGKDTKTDIPTTHRIIEVKADGSFTVKGDANEEADPNPVARREVIGKVLFSVPGAGYVLSFARTKLGFTLLIGIPAGLVILEELFSIFRETQKWYRGRRGRRDGSGGSGGEEVLDLRSHLKSVYTKRYAMDEIKVAMYVEPRWYEAKYWKRQFGIGEDSYQTSTSLTVGLVFFSMMFAGHSGGTVSYFSDIEKSLANILRAGTWGEEQLVDTGTTTPIVAFSLMSEGEVLGTTTPSDTPPDDPMGQAPEQIVEDTEETTEEATTTDTPSDTVEPPPPSTEPEPSPAPEPQEPEPTPEPASDSTPVVE